MKHQGVEPYRQNPLQRVVQWNRQLKKARATETRVEVTTIPHLTWIRRQEHVKTPGPLHQSHPCMMMSRVKEAVPTGMMNMIMEEGLAEIKI